MMYNEQTSNDAQLCKFTPIYILLTFLNEINVAAILTNFNCHKS